MKTIGLLGGMSWESTQSYYRLINEGVKARLGGLHSARLILYSVDFAEIEVLQQQGDWEAAGRLLASAAEAVQAAGADFLLIGTNTMHKVAPQIDDAIDIPLLHIADATAQALKHEGMHSVGLLGTRFTMEQAFYRERLERAGIRVLVPDQEERDEIHRIIYEELCQGDIRPDSRAVFQAVVDSLATRGAQAALLGCTEIGLLLKQSDTPVALFDTTEIHANAAVAAALGGT
ncbi:aspartate/glutamate racemase family protein [Marinobacter qingdaonensis]|uniref:Aspartate/glutamate racemase family protein n=1 Tax=Marinobacter qingdaonensis TaxID=3108486 RepID=A0ABU5P2N9_9GAMM|nr:aspartate/glutamate racemase family protein [Marinobacter sp. ASW11-75]MEA1082304.1 aspartate/glutamate racemase family protein [Marinobacter sp. ASW11-75]